MPRRRMHVPADERRVRFALDELRRELELPDAFPTEVQAEATAAARRAFGAAAADATTPDARLRVDLTDLPFVTLDPPGSTDLDQALHLEREPGGFRVRYAIADVAAFVRPGGAVDREAHRRVETLYAPDGRTPLHPPVLSEGAASLLAGRERPAVVWDVRIDSAGQVLGASVARALVRSREQLAYPRAQRAIDDGTATGSLALLPAVGAALLDAARGRGAVRLPLPEQDVVRDEHGLSLAFRAQLPCEIWNAELSLLTGSVAARMMLDGGVGVLRTMPDPDPRDVRRLRRTAAALDLPWADGEPYADALGRVVATTAAGAAFLHEALVLFRGAAWVGFAGDPPQPARHAAVGAPYAHVTAPLRRLVDRYGLETCLALHAGRPVPDWVLAQLPTVGATMAEGVRRGNALERGAIDVVEAAVLEPHVGQTFSGAVVDVRKEDLVVQLHDPAVVAACDPADVRLGDAVSLRLDTASVEDRRVRFSVLR